MIIIEPKTGFVGTKITDLSYDLQLKEGTFSTSCEDVLVLHKKQLKQIRPQEVGDGMKVIKLQTNASAVKMDVDSVVLGMSVYEWFDEKNGETSFYAYGFERNKLEWVQSICKELSIPVKLHDEKFVRLEGGVSSGDGDVLESLSFFFGLALMYGHLDIGEQGINHIKIHLPLEGTIVQKEEFIKQKIAELSNQGMYMQYSHQDQSSGQLLQIISNDEEILSLWSTWLGQEISLSTSLVDELDILGREEGMICKLLHK